MYNSFEELRADCMTYRKCRLGETRTNLVFGVGNPQSKVLFIGEGPGEQEDLQGEPFVGRSGQLLDKMLQAVDLNRKDNIYIANMVKCRPPQNRDPKPDEQDICMQWLQEQIRLIHPAIIVCLGRIAAQRLISPTFKVTKEHGIFTERNGILYMGTFHPAALLRNPNNKPAAFDDFLQLREKLTELERHTESKNG